MRKVTEQIAHAFRAGRRLTVSNTATDGNTVTLHGNPIARKVGSRLEISLAGWPTNTTHERINGILRVFGSSFGVRRKNRAPVSYDADGSATAMPVDSWVVVSDVRLS
jgi:hypothetical protein